MRRPWLTLDWTAAIPDAGQPTLLDQVRTGVPEAIAQIYDAHHAAVRTFARHLVGEEAAAEDLVHDVFLALPRSIRHFRQDASLRTFLISVVVNHARHHVRAAARRRAAMHRFAAEPAGVSSCPDEEVGRRVLGALLVRGLDSLPFKQRTAFLLCEVDQRSSTEAATILGVSEGTVRTRLMHARRKLRIWLERAGVS